MFIIIILLFSQGKMIYHQTMTPTWLEAHASCIDSSRTSLAQQLTFNANAMENAALLKVPMIPAGVLKVSTPLTVEITVANDVSIGSAVDSDIAYGVSDGTRLSDFIPLIRGIMATLLLALELKECSVQIYPP